MKEFSKRDIILVLFPFTNLEGQKLRPAVVLNGDREDILCVFMTSAKPDDKFFIEIESNKDNGLKQKSFLRFNKIGAISKNKCFSRLGKLSEKDYKKLIDNINKFIK